MRLAARVMHIRRRLRRSLRIGFLAAQFVCVTFPALALDPRSKITDLAHTTFSGANVPFTEVFSLAQTQDGYLWLATTEGLFRFDGERFTRFDPLSRTRVRKMLATRDGSLWVVFNSARVSRLFQGRITTFTPDELPPTNALAEDRDGSVVAATAHGGLARFRDGHWKDIARALHHTAKFSSQVWFDRDDAMWLLTDDRLLSLPPGSDRFIDRGVRVVAQEEAGKRRLFAQLPDGTVWFGAGSRAQTVDARGPRTMLKIAPSTLTVDRQGALWVGTWGEGLWRIPVPARTVGKIIAPHEPGLEQISKKDGLSGESVNCVLEDHEGNVWVATEQGLDRFEEGIFHKVAIPDADRINAIDAQKDGGVVVLLRDRPWVLVVGHDEKLTKLPVGFPVGRVCGDSQGALWVVTSRGFARWTGREFSFPPQPHLSASLPAMSCAFGEFWFADNVQGVFRFSGTKTEHIPGFRPQIYRLIEERPGRAWVSYSDGSVSLYDKGLIRQYGTQDGLAGGGSSVIGRTPDGSVWFGSESGLTRFRDGRFETVDVTPGLLISSVMSGDDGFLWLWVGRALVRMNGREFDKALAKPGYRPELESYGIREGIPSVPLWSVRSGDRIWLRTAEGLGYLDVNLRVRKNSLAPPVHIENVTADGNSFPAVQGLQLPKLTHDVEIDYTALSLTIPEKVQFRYKLEGRDQDWQEPGARRRAYYTDLAPKRYRFRVIAANNDGIWNTEGAAFDFFIRPTWYQTSWFKAACFGIILALLWVLYRYRMHQIAHEFSSRSEERAQERNRIARELHDTLLQSFQASLVQMQAARNIVMPRPEQAVRRLDSAIKMTAEAIAEGRLAIQQLRTQPVPQGDLPELLTVTGEELARTSEIAGSRVVFRVVVEGEKSELEPFMQDEVYRIGSELLRNAFKHSQASEIEAEVRFERRLLRVHVRDNGTGIDQRILNEGGLAGHWGLAGINERAKQIGGRLDFWSESGRGTEAQLAVPASVAYRTPPKRRRSYRLFRNGANP
jgi:signal transduction histidine kinase/ligand-binding sensor domain-containing protein